MCDIVPNFFLVGAAKAGTTSLADYLGQHPDIFLADVKEPKFFSAPDNTFPHQGPGDAEVDAKVIGNQSTYLNLFKAGQNHTIRGEASVDSLYFPGVPQRIATLCPDARILIILRNPVQRAHSAYMHLVRDGRETLTFEDALNAEPKRKADNWEFLWHYAKCGLYATQVERFMKLFGPGKVKVLLFDDFKKDTLGLCQEVFAFLGVDPAFAPDTGLRRNTSGKPKSRLLHSLFHTDNPLKTLLRPLLPQKFKNRIRRQVNAKNLTKEELSPALQVRLEAFYAQDRTRLETLLGANLSCWNMPTK